MQGRSPDAIRGFGIDTKASRLKPLPRIRYNLWERLGGTPL